MAPSLDSISHSFANGVASAKQAVNGASSSLAIAGSHLPTTAVTQVDIVEKMLAAPTDSALELDGYSLNLGDVVSAARKGRTVRVKDSDEIRSKIDKSVEFLRSQLSMSVYGVTTGFGGSADTRTEDAISLQKALLEHQLCGVLPSSFDSFRLGRGLENSLPLEVVRGAMTIRVNSLTRGHSAVRLVVLEALTNFLNHGITPIVPLRGTISASGDLSPLSYIAAAISGHPDSKVHVVHEGKEKILYAREAMALFNLEPVVLGPKEGLGLVNGTAVSASMATLALHDAHMLSLLSQSLTAMTVEAMVGHAGSFHPFLHDVTRPHPTQIEVAGNIRKLLEGSRFAVHHEEEVKVKDDEGILRQDRYPLRTSPQWLGPLVSDLIHAHAVLTIEAGQSTTDNPLIDVENKTSHHGGNFQAAAVANTMEKTRLGLAQIGKLNFTQLTEMLNAGMNRGLPSCLAAEDPSLSYHCKGLDIAAAAYTSELGHLANPVTTHVQPAEMANQAVNSLALISARRTTESNDVLSLLLATHLYCVLQAIDLRAIEFEFKRQFGPTMVSLIDQHFGSALTGSNVRDELVEKVNKTLAKRLEQTNSYDLVPRWHDAFSVAAGTVVEVLSSTSLSLAAVNAWKVAAAEAAISLTRQVRDAFWTTASTSSPALSYLSPRTQILYSFVREELAVKARRGDVFLGKQEVTIGSNVSKIYEAIKSGRINSVLLKMLA
ncbi:phenylalanine/tyrosine ammonia-lyase [Rhodotorula toruloides]|uniref:Phenylalanine/tyrosine ammonia-lyase n=1 Tax=Rhodotorula toruloides TaxID=5286 RepID=A0A511K9Y5_RHOTO|nr:phenylalanine/tyrosine ammonia-lyase [Rhodotorula toruloides]